MAQTIDAHQHYWMVQRGDYHWMPPSGPLRHDYLPQHLAPLLAPAAIDGTILVQAAQTVEETQFLLDLAMQPGSNVLGVVGWVALDSDMSAAQLEEFAKHPKAVAVRPMLHDLPEVDWITRPKVIESLRLLPALGLRFDVLSYPEHLPHVHQAIETIPELNVVINHLSKPCFRDGVSEDWRRWMAALAKNSRVYCKLSGMVTEVGPGWTADDFRAHGEFILETFGPNRVMFGSDWPVCLQAASYWDVVQLADSLTSHLNEVESENVWGLTAARFYGV